MNEYALAKELADQGFPFKETKRAVTGYVLPNGSPIFLTFEEGWLPADAVRVPTLGELLAACGDGFGGLVRLENGLWSAASPVIDTGISYGNPTTELLGPNPWVALVRLWQALNGHHPYEQARPGTAQHPPEAEA